MGNIWIKRCFCFFLLLIYCSVRTLFFDENHCLPPGFEPGRIWRKLHLQHYLANQPRWNISHAWTIRHVLPLIRVSIHHRVFHRKVSNERGALGRRRSGRRGRVERAQGLAQLVEQGKASEDRSIPDNSTALWSARRERRSVVARLSVERSVGHVFRWRRHAAVGVDVDGSLRHGRDVANALATGQAVAEFSITPPSVTNTAKLYLL